ncbi:hypothetical protein OPV22_014174 [Ensete ventricosum]|uniref:Uncharacterized protein n=1 Tax=Ensete ventricosum TaxID=4639 RepID=A0AAV8R2P4_ENSVE|nr:hypothetical protein OPV22_014174 [Ensete ventricosum]
MIKIENQQDKVGAAAPVFGAGKEEEHKPDLGVTGTAVVGVLGSGRSVPWASVSPAILDGWKLSAPRLMTFHGSTEGKMEV